MTSEPKPILIVGGLGKTGGRVNRRLEALGHPTRAVSRSSALVFDWNRRETWPAAVAGTRAAYITYQPDLAVPRAEDDIDAFIRLARDHGLEHLVLLSGRGEEGAERAEDVLKASGIAWTIVQASWFCQNFSESFMVEGILGGELVLPAGDIPEPFVDADDIAEVVAAVLTNPTHRDKVYELTGPRSMSFAACVQEISRALGYEIRYTTVPVDDYIEALRVEGVPREMRWLLRELFTKVLDGRNSATQTGISQVLGRDPTDFREYVGKAIRSGAWTREQSVRRTS